MRGVALRWFSSFLSNRKHFVKINNSVSNQKTLNIGVPQGSLISLLLFLLYINDLPNFSSSVFPILFADDTTLCFSGPILSDLIVSCNRELSKFKTWAVANRLSLNVDKTNYMIISNRNRNIVPCVISINNLPLEYKSNVKFLGVILDDNLKFNNHIKLICTKISKSIGILNSIKHFVPTELLHNLYFSFIYPYLNYCVVIWGGTFSTHLQPLRVIQKRAIRTVNKKPYLHHTNPLFFHSALLKLDDIFKLKICNYLYKNNLTITFYRHHDYGTRFANLLLPVYQRLTATQRSINFIGPSIWNLLPQDLKESPSIHSFNRRLREYFIEAYGTSL